MYVIAEVWRSRENHFKWVDEAGNYRKMRTEMVGDRSSRRAFRLAVGLHSTDFEGMSFRISSRCKISDKLIR